MIKTIVNRPGEDQTWPSDSIQAIQTQCDTWQYQGKYTGEKDVVFDSGAIVSRWDWADETTAQAYVDLVKSYFNDEVTIQIVIE